MMHPEVKPIESQAKQLVVLLHGLGASGHDLISIVPFMNENFPTAHFFAPHGIEPYDVASFGRQWFSLQNRNPLVLRNELKRTTPLIMNLIQDKQKQLELSNQNTILIGFSQGTMTSIYLALCQKTPFKAIIGFSGALITPREVICKKTPICLIHGIEDNVVNYQLCLEAYENLKSLGIEVEQHGINNLDHSIDLKGINIANSFIKKVI